MNKLFRIIQVINLKQLGETGKYTVTASNLIHSNNLRCMNYSTSGNMITGKKFILEKQFSGFPKETDVKLVEDTLAPLRDGEFLCQSIYISVDPYQRAYYQKVGNVVLGSQVARIIESRNSKFPVGRHVIANYGWKTHHVLNENPSPLGFPTRLIPDNLNQPLNYYLGVLGLTGVSAFFGFLEICHPKPGETVIITGAAGAVGSIVGQIAKIKGCQAIGVVGSDEKGKWITDDLGFDGYVNYKRDDYPQAIKKLAPKGIDCYFDNVGGEISSEIMKQMNKYGRISVCGAISTYNNMKDYKASSIQGLMVLHELKMEGFHVTRWMDRWDEAVIENAQWVHQGKLKSRETITKGFENTFTAFTGMLKGNNFGKALVEL